MSSPVYGYRVPQPWAWAVMVGNAPIINLPEAGPAALVGGLLAVCAGEGYDVGTASWMSEWNAVRAPQPEALSMDAVVAVARVHSLVDGGEVPLGWRWHSGGPAVLLERVVQVGPLPYGAPAGFHRLPADVAELARQGWQQAEDARVAGWEAYNARAAAAMAPRPPPPTLREKVLRLCPCKKAMSPCPRCRAWYCSAHPENPHTCPPGTPARVVESTP